MRGKLRIDLGHFRRDDLAQEPQGRSVGRRCDAHVIRPIEVEAGVLDDLIQAVAGMQAGETEAPPRAIAETREGAAPDAGRSDPAPEQPTPPTDKPPTKKRR